MDMFRGTGKPRMDRSSVGVIDDTKFVSFVKWGSEAILNIALPEESVLESIFKYG